MNRSPRRLNLARPLSMSVAFVLVVAAASASIAGPALAGNAVSAVATSAPVSFPRIDGANIAYRDLNPQTGGRRCC
jgi:hypothetical protein